MARLLARIVALNDGWARPFGEFNHRWTSGPVPRDPADPRPAQGAAGSGTRSTRLRPTSRSGSCSARSSSTSSVSPRRRTYAGRDDHLHGALGARRARRLQRDAGNGVDSGDAPRDADDHGAGRAHRLGAPARGTHRRPDRADRALDHRLPGRHRRRVRRRRCRLRTRQHGQPPRVPRAPARNGSASTPAT